MEEEALVTMEHPLEHTWGFWMYTNDKKKWEDNLVKLTSFGTVEEYWRLHHHMKRPSELNLGQEYSIFKQDIQPKWEDQRNEKGGRWVINLEKRHSDMDWMWLDMVLLMIGENFENNNIVCGVVVNVRARCKISVWTAIADEPNREANIEIGRKLKDQLSINGKLHFQVHNSSKNIYSV